MSTAEAQPKTSSKTAWKQASAHSVTLPSGTVVKIKVPNLPALVKAGAVPNELIEVAVQQADPERKVTVEDIRAEADFNRFLVSVTLIDPKIEPEEVDDLPFEDVQLLIALATRQTDRDAVGHQLGGLELTEEWKSFRDEQLGIAAAFGLAGVG